MDKPNAMAKTQYIVGIDLGTTHCALSAAALQDPAVHLRKIPQLVALGQVSGQTLLPSFMYLPARGELPATELALPWGPQEQVVGALAHQLGAKAPNRLVASAKSWVCHGGVNRRAPILPWNAPDGQEQISPFEAQVAYLAHLRAAWEHQHPDAPLHEQDVVVTVPASFDEGSRTLTSEAAAEAGLGDVHLLEEPQAAFYDFLGAHTDDLAAQLGTAKLILVVDVGGGTTDLTLLTVAPDSQTDKPRVDRIAVGGHLMLGGDNMDAALASFALDKAKMQRPDDATLWSALVQSARRAKETLFGDDAPEQCAIAHQSRGSKLIAATRSIVVSRAEAEQVVLDGFFPITEADETARRSARAGLTTLGLPYTSDAAIPRHICAFLRRHVEAAVAAGSTVVGGLPQPDLLLLNGGVFKSTAIVAQLRKGLAHWFGDQAPRMLDSTSLDTAVADGAVRSGLARRGLGERIGGGTARAYYIEVETAKNLRQAMCIAPRGMEHGTVVSVANRTFDLMLNRPVSFPLHTYTGDRLDAPGDLVDLDDSLDSLPPLETLLRARRSAELRNDTVQVSLLASMAEKGALELSLVTVELPPRRWTLELVTASQHVDAPKGAVAQNADEQQKSTLPAPPRLAESLTLLAAALSGDDIKAIKSVRRNLENSLGPRGRWSVDTCRAIWEVCMEHEDRRATSEQHELGWLRLCGWGLRPGFGAADDESRMQRMSELREHGLHIASRSNWAEWWILWRRIAGGLDLTPQQQLFTQIEAWLWRGPQLPPGTHMHGEIEMMRLLASLEHLPVSQKTRAGELFFTRAKKLGSFWPLGRVGARVPFHASATTVVPARVAEAWIDRLLELDWPSAEGAAFAAASIARLSANLEHNVGAEHRSRVIKALTKAECSASWIDMVERGDGLSDNDVKRIFGESLPVGLRLTSAHAPNLASP